MPKKHVIFDTDPGIDDSLAILLALASPELIVDGISVVHGNASAEQGTINALSVLELAGASHIPVYKGYDLPLVQPSLLAPETHGEHGIGYADLREPKARPQVRHGCDYLTEHILSHPGEITVVAIGPLTNLALAIRQEPRLVHTVKEVFIMGGALRHPGNTTPAAEFNAYVDPHAAHIVLHSGMPITLTPLDVTYQCILTRAHVERLQKIDSPVTRFIADATRFYMEYHDEYQNLEGCVINDPLTLALTFMPELCTYQDLFLDVDLSGGLSMGATIADFYGNTGKPANVKVATGVQPRAFIETFLTQMEKLAASIS